MRSWLMQLLSCRAFQCERAQDAATHESTPLFPHDKISRFCAGNESGSTPLLLILISFPHYSTPHTAHHTSIVS